MKISAFILSLILLSGSVFAADTFRVVRGGIAVTTTSPVFSTHIFDIKNLSANTTTPNVSTCSVLITGTNTGATTITGFTGATTGQIITLIGKSTTASNATKITDSGVFKLNGNFTASANNVIRIFVRGSADYVEIGRSNNL